MKKIITIISGSILILSCAESRLQKKCPDKLEPKVKISSPKLCKEHVLLGIFDNHCKHETHKIEKVGEDLICRCLK